MKMNDYPIWKAKVVIESEFKINSTHTSRIEYVEATFFQTTEIDAIKSCMDALLERYNYLLNDGG